MPGATCLHSTTRWSAESKRASAATSATPPETALRNLRRPRAGDPRRPGDRRRRAPARPRDPRRRPHRRVRSTRASWRESPSASGRESRARREAARCSSRPPSGTSSRARDCGSSPEASASSRARPHMDALRGPSRMTPMRAVWGEDSRLNGGSASNPEDRCMQAAGSRPEKHPPLRGSSRVSWTLRRGHAHPHAHLRSKSRLFAGMFESATDANT